MNEREALLRAVCENPDDDTPRLVFADWLQENGEEARAEFIRLQCRWAQGVTEGDTLEDMNQRKMRELTLWEKFGDHWLAELPSCDGFELDWGGPFKRGFAGEWLQVNPVGVFELDGPRYPDGIDCPALDWERLLWSAPITRLHLWDLRNWGVIFIRPEADRLKSALMCDCGVDADNIDPLLHWAGRTAGHLIVKQEPVVVESGRQLREAFGDRFEWTTLWCD
jgi:uncharacterized protein (TIGR02996 family)